MLAVKVKYNVFGALSPQRIRLSIPQKLFSTASIPASNVVSGNVKPFDKIPGPPRLPFVGNLYLYKLGNLT